MLNGISSYEWDDWKWQLANSLKGINGLKTLLNLDTDIDTDRCDAIDGLKEVIKRYPFKVSPYYASLCRLYGLNFKNPIFKQIVPSLNEISYPPHPLSSKDPFREGELSPVPSLIHRYSDRALLLATAQCASYCRHCNRKRHWIEPSVPTLLNRRYREMAMSYLAKNKAIREVILSGGDPFMLSTESIKRILSMIRAIRHIEVIRIGTRAPVTMPMRVTKGLVAMLKKFRPVWINTHFNHPLEITREATIAIDRLLCSGLPVSNQAVLLKGVNNSYEVLKGLFTGLQAIGVRPYYLFHCDPVMGADHFRTTIKEGIDIMDRLWGKIGGLCMPFYVFDLPDAEGKAILSQNHIISRENGYIYLKGMSGNVVKWEEKGHKQATKK